MPEVKLVIVPCRGVLNEGGEKKPHIGSRLLLLSLRDFARVPVGGQGDHRVGTGANTDPTGSAVGGGEPHRCFDVGYAIP